MKRKLITALLLTGCLGAMPAVTYAADYTATTLEVKDEADEAKPEKEEAEETPTEVEEEVEEEKIEMASVYDFTAKVNDELYQLPMSYEEFTSLGWELDKNYDESSMVPSGSYGTLVFNKKNDTVMVDVINPGINEVTADQCLVAGIKFDSHSMDVSGIELPCGIMMGESGIDDIEAAYGTPTDTYSSDLYTKYTYEQDNYQDVCLYVYTDDNTLKQVEMRNFTTPEGYDEGSVSDETPDIVAAYKTPDALGDNIMAPTVEFCGDLYDMPFPVSALIENGWELKETDEEFVEGDGMAFIEMSRDNQNFKFTVYNETPNAVTHENCFVREIQVGTYDNEAFTFKISGDVTLGAKKADMIQIAEDNDWMYKDEDGYLRIYTSKDTELDNFVEFWFDEDKDAESAAAVTYHNEIMEDVEVEETVEETAIDEEPSEENVEDAAAEDESEE